MGSSTWNKSKKCHKDGQKYASGTLGLQVCFKQKDAQPHKYWKEDIP